MIQAGDKIPSVTLKRLGVDGLETVDTGTLFAHKKVVLFSVPGAFTPTCSQKHLPGYVEHASDFRAKGVDVYCMAVNDPWVMPEWGRQARVDGKVTMLPDGNAEFTRALGLELDGSGSGMGVRAKRFALYAEDGLVKRVNVERDGEFNTSSAMSMLETV